MQKPPPENGDVLYGRLLAKLAEMEQKLDENFPPLRTRGHDIGGTVHEFRITYVGPARSAKK